MEQQCKRGGQSLRNREVVNEDRISELPEDLLVKILSSLPAKNVTATCVLSKQWRCLWKMVPINLMFDSDKSSKFKENVHKSDSDKSSKFTENVHKSLLFHKALDSLHLKIGRIRFALNLGTWIRIAFARHVRKLVLDFHLEEEGLVISPASLCSFNDTLEIMKLKYSILLVIPSPVCLKSLRKLHLYYVKFKDEASLHNLLCGCPSLEDLVVHRKCYLDVETFTIAVPSLQRLTVEDDLSRQHGGGYVINAPSLKYLNILGFHDIEFFLIENKLELVEAKIINVSNIPNENILRSLTSVKRLSLHLSPLKPIDPYCNKEDCPVEWKWEQPKCVPECLLFHLERFVWRRYEWQREDEKEVATYILKNARLLKKTTFSTKPIHSKEVEKLEKRREMLNELVSVAGASNSCHIVFESK
ncbi:unnamed protein product [Microthlaspi erraticum]|uniref:F-box domain-containing protein n=1 Tax=Microthlaspi erraticum TaxID=1685480 RepID=A0A6D2L9T9_9BRAS|nr:unnamed protein product [Microthlaspi erraticum]